VRSNADKISRRVAALHEELNRIPDPAREAEKKLKWQAAIAAFAHGDPKPPDDHVETLAIWDTLVKYHDVFLKARQDGLI
jgi:hypothetical protein